jgi:hypothetical protein
MSTSASSDQAADPPARPPHHAHLPPDTGMIMIDQLDRYPRPPGVDGRGGRDAIPSARALLTILGPRGTGAGNTGSASLANMQGGTLWFRADRLWFRQASCEWSRDRSE